MILLIYRYKLQPIAASRYVNNIAMTVSTIAHLFFKLSIFAAA